MGLPKQREQVEMPSSISSIFCIGRNYADHAKELGNSIPTTPIVFLKASTSWRGLTPVPMGFDDDHFHFESEIVVRIGRPLPLKTIASWDDVKDLTIGIDLTRREVQNDLKAAGMPWTTAKSFQGSAITGPFLPKESFTNLNAIGFSFHVNDVLRQHGNSKDMLFSIPKIITYLASFNALAENDIIFTGTPQGVGPIKVGDKFTMKFDSLDEVMVGKL